MRREVRHSDFLSFLLNQKESHGLYDVFLKSLLFSVTKRNRSISSLSAIDIDLLDLANIEVRREWENIDILLLSEKEQFVCAIENKIDSTEHSNQLARNEALIESNFSNYKKLFVYLTIEGDSPEKDLNWLPCSYQDIYEVAKSILEETAGNIGEDIYTLLKHYAEMIKRHLMSDNEIVELSKKLYQRHKKALDIIFEHKPDILTETNKCIVEYLEKYSNSGLVIDHCTKSYVRFAVNHWDKINGQKSGDGQWTKSNRVVLFEVINSLSEISLKLLIGPGQKEFREELFAATANESTIFKGRSKSLYGKWTQIYKRKIVTKEQMDYDLESVENLIKQELGDYFHYGEFENLCKFIDSKYGIADNKE